MTKESQIQAEKVSESDLHKMVSSLYDIQHARIIIENRFRGTKNNALIAFLEDSKTIKTCKKCKNEIEIRSLGFTSYEENLKLIIKSMVKEYPIHNWIISQKGLSYDMAGQLIGLIQDIKKFDNVSKLWAYFGLAVVDVCQDCEKRWYPLNQRAEKILHISKRLMEQHEKKIVKEGKSDLAKDASEMVCTCKEPHIKKTSQRKIKGALIDYNPTAKMVAYKVGTQFVKQGDLYRKLYDQFRNEYLLREDLKIETSSKKGKIKKGKNGAVIETKGTAHIHAMAQRKMVKIFLQHLWVQWRTLENLPVSKPYVIDRMGHSDYIQPDIS